MRPTRRGYAALAVVALALVFAWAGDPDRAQSLNAVAAPVLAAVAAGGVAVYRTGRPTVERTAPDPGVPGTTRTVELTVSGTGVAGIVDGVGDGLSGSSAFDRSLPATVDYEVRYEERGVHSLGPTSVCVRDVLGLVEERHRIDERTRVVVYPRVYAVGDQGSFRRTLGPDGGDRSEFDRLREYVPGDSLRDVHWKSSAKRGDLLVTEYTGRPDEEAVTVAARCAAGHADEMAAAAATAFVAALRAGSSVGLAVPAGTLPRGRGDGHERRGLELLARTGSGDVADGDWAAADVRVRADGTGVAVTVDDREYSLAELTAGRDTTAPTEATP